MSKLAQHDAIPLLTPMLPTANALLPYLQSIDERRLYSNFGPLVKALETRLEKIFTEHSPQPLHVRTVSSCTQGLELALTALDLPPGSKVLVPALTFVATLTAVLKAGHVPVIADIDPHNWLITQDITLNAAEATGAAAVIAVATFGQAQETAAWSAFQDATGVKVVIDAAAAYGTQWVTAPNIPVVFSMHATKSLAAGEGGFVVTGDADIAKMIMEMSNFGINLNPDADHPVGHLSYAGTNAKLSEYHAAVAHASLDLWDYQADLRHSVYQNYRTKLEAACGPAIHWQAGPIPAAPTTLCLRLPSSNSRCMLEKNCAEAGIGTRRWYQPLLHQHAARVAPIEHLPTPVAEEVSADLIGLPFSIYLTEMQIDRIVDTVRSVVKLPSLLPT